MASPTHSKWIFGVQWLGAISCGLGLSLGAGGWAWMDGERGGREREGVGRRVSEIRDGGGGWAGRRRLALTEVGLEMEMGRLSLSHGGQGGGTIYLCAF